MHFCWKLKYDSYIAVSAALCTSFFFWVQMWHHYQRVTWHPQRNHWGFPWPGRRTVGKRKGRHAELVMATGGAPLSLCCQGDQRWRLGVAGCRRHRGTPPSAVCQAERSLPVWSALIRSLPRPSDRHCSLIRCYNFLSTQVIESMFCLLFLKLATWWCYEWLVLKCQADVWVETFVWGHEEWKECKEGRKEGGHSSPQVLMTAYKEPHGGALFEYAEVKRESSQSIKSFIFEKGESIDPCGKVTKQKEKCHLRCADFLLLPRPAAGGGGEASCRGEGRGAGRGRLKPAGHSPILLPVDWRPPRDPAETSQPDLTHMIIDYWPTSESPAASSVCLIEASATCETFLSTFMTNEQVKVQLCGELLKELCLWWWNTCRTHFLLVKHLKVRNEMKNHPHLLTCSLSPRLCLHIASLLCHKLKSATRYELHTHDTNRTHSLNHCSIILITVNKWCHHVTSDDTSSLSVAPHRNHLTSGYHCSSLLSDRNQTSERSSEASSWF